MMDYTSQVVKRSAAVPGVEYTIARLSLGRRIELGQQVREVGFAGEFLAASQSVLDQVDAAILQRRIDRVYLEWGLLAVKGLRIDGVEATPAAVIASGPEELTSEILAAIRAELQLSEEERKN